MEVKIEGEKREIPQAVDLSAYRIIEEALTNTLKHAGATKATMNMNYQNSMLLLDITDNGHGIANDSKISFWWKRFNRNERKGEPIKRGILGRQWTERRISC